MKLRVRGVICPDCGNKMDFLGSLCYQDTWMGYTRLAWCNCNYESYEDRCYLILYDDNKRFVGIVPGGPEFLGSAGNRVNHFGDGDIPS